MLMASSDRTSPSDEHLRQERQFPSDAKVRLPASLSMAGGAEGLVQEPGDVPAVVPEEEMDLKGQLSLTEIHHRLVGGRRSLEVVTGELGDEQAASRAAWSKVMDGFAEALIEPHLGDDDRQFLADGYRAAARACGRRPLLLAPSHDGDRAAV